MKTKTEQHWYRIEELKESYEDYIGLLALELNDLAVLASVHGWKSQRVEAGDNARRRIDKAKSQLFNCTKD
jgi:hypothetical protein